MYMGPTYFSLQVDVSTFSFIIFNVLFPLGPWSQQHRRPSEGRAEQQNCQDTEPRGPGDRHRGLRPLHRLRCGCGFFILIHYFYFPVKSHIGRCPPPKNANNINIFSIWFVFWCSQKNHKNEISDLWGFVMPHFTLSCLEGFASVQHCFTTQVALTYYPDIFKAHSNQQLQDIFMPVPGGETLRRSDRIYGCKYALTNSSPSKCMLTEYIREKHILRHLRDTPGAREISIV